MRQKCFKYFGVGAPWIVPMYYMLVYELDRTCGESRKYVYGEKFTTQLENLLSILSHEADIYITFGLGLLAVVGALLITSEDKSEDRTVPVPYSMVFFGSSALSATITALYLAYFSVRVEMVEIESGRLCIPVFNGLALSIGVWLLLGALLTLVVLLIRMRRSI